MTLGTLQPIETRYKGYRFRSRLEARWAVFFDAMGWQWEYEPEGYTDGHAAYLPDFVVLVPFSGGAGHRLLFVEIKPHLCADPKQAKHDRDRWTALSTSTNQAVVILCGVPGDDRPVLVSDVNGKTHEFASFSAAFVGNLRHAIAAARSARFEHGESGAN